MSTNARQAFARPYWRVNDILGMPSRSVHRKQVGNLRLNKSKAGGDSGSPEHQKQLETMHSQEERGHQEGIALSSRQLHPRTRQDRTALRPVWLQNLGGVV